MSKKILTLIALGAVLQGRTQKDTASGKPLDEVVVTANKVEQKQSTTGKVITVINQAELQRSAGKTVAQVLNEQAGIWINGATQATGSVQTVYMRGANAGRALILLDGIPVSDPSEINNSYDLNMFSINDVERIEICKGAQSTLYGSDAIAGVINIITVKKNITQPVNVKATVGIGNQSTSKTNLQVYGKAGKLTYTTRFSKLRTNGFSAAYDSTGTKNFDNDGYNGDMVNASVQYQATEALSLKTFVQHSQYKADVDASGFSDKRNYFINNKTLNTGVGFNLKKEKYSVVGNYQYGTSKRLYDDNASFPGATNYSLNDYNSRSQFVELYTNLKLGKGFSLVAGTDYRWALMNNVYTSVSSFGPYNSSFRDTTANQKSVYASIIYAHKKFNIELGGRYNNHSKYGDNSTFTFNPSYTINEHLRAFGSIATGFKAPSLYQLYASGGTGNPNLNPEKSTNYELGLQQQYSKISHRLVGFYREINNGIDYDNVKFSYFNYVKQKVSGLEYEIAVHPTKALSITANYTFIKLEEITQNRVNAKDTTYTYGLRRPKHSINATIGYQFTPSFFISVSGKTASKRYDLGGYKKEDVTLDAFFILNAYAEYKLKENIKFFINVQNITDKKFYEIRGYNSIPLMANGGVTFDL